MWAPKGNTNSVDEWRPKKFNSAEEMQEKLDAYYKRCEKGEKRTMVDKKTGEVNEFFIPIPYSVEGMVTFLDICRETMCDYEKDICFSDTIKRAKQKVLSNQVESVLMNKINSTYTIFSHKNNFGMKDRTEVDNNTTVTIVDPSKASTGELMNSINKK